jgi:hypothetical protein
MWQSLIVWLLVIGATVYVLWTLWPRSLLPKAWLARKAQTDAKPGTPCNDCGAPSHATSKSSKSRS